jgi:EAL domain-containing protein (putative c-di-GMP-specific phosphodiesterase class I)/FixJ family two-component response regulator
MSTEQQDGRIILVDDDPLQLKLVAQLLAKLGVGRESIHMCQSGGEVFDRPEFLESGAPLMILDLVMPDMDGVEVVRRLAEEKFTGSLVFLSGVNMRVKETVANLARARFLRVLGYLDKPIQYEALQDVLVSWRTETVAGSRSHGRLFSPEEVGNAIKQGQLCNFYQPKVEVASGALCGVETLVRWQHPVEGLVFPDQFIPVAEANGLIHDLTRHVLSSALRQAKQWYETGLPLRVAVNVSMANLNNVEFANFVFGELDRSGMLPQSLILEVTESCLMTDAPTALDILSRLCLKRISLSIDDFGTGHSSLAQLRDMPFDELKIDRGFVHGASQNKVMGAIFEGSMKMARQLNMSVVGEGVEDQDDWDYLRDHHCQLAQGYFVAKPMSAEAVSPWAAEWTQRWAEHKSS